MSQSANPQIERDDAADAQQQALFEQLTQDAMNAWRDYLLAKKRFDEASARLAPFRNRLLQVAA